MKIYKTKNEKAYMPLLLLADEQESMIAKYLDRGEMFLLDDGGVKGEILVTDEGDGVLEIKNLAVLPAFQRCGYGKELIRFVCEKYKDKFCEVRVGTGDSSLTVPFYEKCGFERFATVKDFFTENYDHPIIEQGVLLKDMIYLKKRL